MLLTGFIVVSFGSLILYLYIDGLDVANRKGLIVIRSYYAQLHDEGSFDKEVFETKAFSSFVGQENLPDSISSLFPHNSFSNYKLYKNHLDISEDQQQDKSNFVLFTAIPIDNGKRQLFAVYHFLHNGNPAITTRPPILETVLLTTFGVFFSLLLAVFCIARRFNIKVLEPIEALADMAHKVDETTPDISESL